MSRPLADQATRSPGPALVPRVGPGPQATAKRVAVVGAGLFGVTCALALDRAGCRVSLFEQRADIMQGATAASMNRVHLGYHYPRSVETISAVRRAERSFRAEYGSAIIDDLRHLYMVARAGSQTSTLDFRSVCIAAGLPWRDTACELADPQAVESIVEVDEGTIDLRALRDLARSRLARSGVDLKLGTPASSIRRSAFDDVVLATYANPSARLSGQERRSFGQLRFDVCEVMVARLPPAYRNLSIVVMDGPFFSIDPLARSGLSLLYHVVHSVHLRRHGAMPRLPPWMETVIDAGRLPLPRRSNFSQVIADASAFLRDLTESEYVGSLFSVRVVRTDSEASSARLTSVTRTGPGVVEVFSGKLVNCTEAAKATVCEIMGRAR